MHLSLESREILKLGRTEPKFTRGSSLRWEGKLSGVNEAGFAIAAITVLAVNDAQTLTVSEAEKGSLLIDTWEFYVENSHVETPARFGCLLWAFNSSSFYWASFCEKPRVYTC